VRLPGQFRPRHTCECRDCGSQGSTRRWRKRVEQREVLTEIQEAMSELGPDAATRADIVAKCACSQAEML
jgi:hypothetical protein